MRSVCRVLWYSRLRPCCMMILRLLIWKKIWNLQYTVIGKQTEAIVSAINKATYGRTYETCNWQAGVYQMNKVCVLQAFSYKYVPEK